MSAHVLFNSLKELANRDKMLGITCRTSTESKHFAKVPVCRWV